MNRKVSLAIHDLRVSDNAKTVSILKELLTNFEIPLTVHLVFDDSLQNVPDLFVFLLRNEAIGFLEVVFHGLNHQCPKDIGRGWAFYHKYQAEYLEDSDVLRTQTSAMYLETSTLLGHKPGICTPCWIVHPKNFLFFQTLRPAFIERMLSMIYSQRKVFSPVVSLGSPGKFELHFLKGLARVMYLVSIWLPKARVRVAIHPSDIENPCSLSFLRSMVSQLTKKGFEPVLLKNLL